jgi:hypothetical protein
MDECKRLFCLAESVKIIVPLLSLARSEFLSVSVLKIKLCCRVFTTFEQKIILGLFDLEYEGIEILRNVESYSPKNTATCPME